MNYDGPAKLTIFSSLLLYYLAHAVNIVQGEQD